MRQSWRTLSLLALLALLVTRPAAAQGGFHVMVDQFGTTSGEYGTWGTNVGIGLHAPLSDNRWFSPSIDIDVVPASGGAKRLYFPLTGAVSVFLLDPKERGSLLPWLGYGYSCILHLGNKSTTAGGYTGDNVCSNVIVGGVGFVGKNDKPWYLQVQYWTSEEVPRVAVSIHVPVF
jgi:hypothetical protein